MPLPCPSHAPRQLYQLSHAVECTMLYRGVQPSDCNGLSSVRALQGPGASVLWLPGWACMGTMRPIIWAGPACQHSFIRVGDYAGWRETPAGGSDEGSEEHPCGLVSQLQQCAKLYRKDLVPQPQPRLDASAPPARPDCTRYPAGGQAIRRPLSDVATLSPMSWAHEAQYHPPVHRRGL